MLRRFPPSRGWLLADAGFDGKEVWGVLGEAGVRPVIRLRGGGEAREEARVRALLAAFALVVPGLANLFGLGLMGLVYLVQRVRK